VVLQNKQGLDCFTGTNLEAILQEYSISTVGLCGFLANVCVESTMRTAFDKGLHVVTLTDCVAATSLEALRSATQISFHHFSQPATSDVFLAALEHESHHHHSHRSHSTHYSHSPDGLSASVNDSVSEASDDLNSLRTSRSEWVLFEGYVHKKSRWLGTWRSRWVVITPYRLVFFQDRDAAREAEETSITEPGTENFDLSGVGSAVPTSFPGISPLGLAVCITGRGRSGSSICCGALVERELLLHFGESQTAITTALRNLLITALVNARESAQHRASVSGAESARATDSARRSRDLWRSHLSRHRKSAAVHAFESSRVHFEERYELGDMLGEGGQGVVHAVTCLQSGERMAAKLISKVGLSRNAKARLRKEVDLQRQVDYHPNICSVFNFYDEPRRMVVVMELLPYGTLYDHVVAHFSSGGRLDDDEYNEAHVSRLLQQALSALTTMHDRGIVHRDLKPENVLLVDAGANGEVGAIRIADFGLAAQPEPGDELCECVGTPGYTAPEVLAGLPYDTSVDVFSLGAMLYALLSGCEAFAAPGLDDEEVLQRNRIGRYKFDASWAGVSSEAKAVVKAMLMREPSKRATARALLAEGWVQGPARSNTEPLRMAVRVAVERQGSLVNALEGLECVSPNPRSARRSKRTSTTSWLPGASWPSGRGRQ
jgi:calcium-dependent protein kinase